MRSVEPFGTPDGGIIAPPVDVPEHAIAVAWDSINGGIAGVETTGAALSVSWHLDARASMQPIVFPESGELVTNDFSDAGHDDLIVVDVATGVLLDRVRDRVADRQRHVPHRRRRSRCVLLHHDHPRPRRVVVSVGSIGSVGPVRLGRASMR